MGIFSSALKVERRSISTSDLKNPAWWLLNAVGGSDTASSKAVTPESALTFVAVYACVNLISSTIASLPLPVYKRLPGGGKERDYNHPLYDLLHNKPNPEMTSYELRQAMTGHRELWGNAYGEIELNGAGRPVALWPLRPDRMEITRISRTNEIVYVYTLPDGSRKGLLAEQVFHWRGLSLDGIAGLSVIGQAREAIGMGQAAEEYGARFFANDSRPGGFLKAPNKLMPDDAKKLKEGWESVHGGLSNRHRVAVLEAGIEWQAVGMPNDEAQYLETRQFQRSEIPMLFGIPPHMIGDTDKVTSWGCLPGDTQIFTIQGPRDISTIQAGDEVWSLVGNRLEPRKVVATRMTGYRQIMTIKTHQRTLRLTDNHRVYVRRYVSVGYGAPGVHARWDNMWIPACEVMPGDYLAMPHKFSTGVGIFAPNGRKLTVRAMELCGLYLGDGSSDKNRIEIDHEVDADHMDYYRQSIRDEFGVEPYADKRGTRTRFSSQAAHDLVNCGLMGTSHTKQVPAWVYKLTPELQLALLRGYLDSDGSVQRGRIIYSSCNHALLEQIRHLCMLVGIPVGRVCFGRAGGVGYIRGRRHNSVTKYQLSLSTLRHNFTIGSNSPRKLSRFTEDVSKRKLRYDLEMGDTGLPIRFAPSRGWDYEGMVLSAVTSATEPSGVFMPVYDIEVEGGESFIADGMLVHNSGIEQLSVGFVTYSLRSRLVSFEQRIALDLFTETERRTWFAEFLVDGLLRGDAASRAQALAIQRQNGVINADEWREIENRNPLPNGEGQKFLVNSAMIGPNEAAGEGVQE